MEAFDGADAVVHLAGEPIAEGRWTAKRKGIIEKSRVKGTFNLVDTLLRCPNPPRTFVSGSAIGYYGSKDEQVLDETADPGDGFLAHICRRWEQEARRVRERGIRVVFARTGLVLSTELRIHTLVAASFAAAQSTCTCVCWFMCARRVSGSALAMSVTPP